MIKYGGHRVQTGSMDIVKRGGENSVLILAV